MSKKSKHYFKDPAGNVSEYFFDYFGKYYRNPINTTNFPQEFFPIVSIFVEDSFFNVKQLYADWNRLFIRGDNYNLTKSNELMLRIHDDKLVIARLKFIHQRAGNMTRLYRLLTEIQRKYDLKYIELEQCITESSINWCKKNGFVSLPNKPECYVSPKDYPRYMEEFEHLMPKYE